MPNLEPSYLRYVFDNLSNGALNPENEAALPYGFIGLYEKEFSKENSLKERQYLLTHLAIWALFKGPVSAALASNILKVSEADVKDLIDRYSSWFNSPESGKYQLYHERLRVFILQKLNDKEIQTLNEQIISYLESTVKQADGSEDEKYALQFLHNHMALESMLGVDYERLHNYVNQESLWERQINVSKGYEWSQNAIQQGIKEGARRNHEMNTIRSTVNSVKLMTKEQNSAEAIIELLNEGDYHSALKRAASWEGDRQFKLYLLFIHELTIGTSKEANFRKEACKAVLEAIDQTPEDHSILDWTKFYPELAIYKYYEQLLIMELDGMVIWRRGDFTLLDILAVNIGEFATYQKLTSIWTKNKEDSLDPILGVNFKESQFYSKYSELLCLQGDFEKSRKITKSLKSSSWRDSALRNISIELAEQEGFSITDNVALQIDDITVRLKTLVDQAYVFIWRKDLSKVQILLDIVEEGIREIISPSIKVGLNIKLLYSYTLLNDSVRVSALNTHIEESLNEISNLYERHRCLLQLLKVYFSLGKFSEVDKIINQVLIVSDRLNAPDYWGRASGWQAYKKLAEILLMNNRLKQALEVTDKISEENNRSFTFSFLAKLLYSTGDYAEANKIIDLIDNSHTKARAYLEISEEMILKSNMDKANYAIENALAIALKYCYQDLLQSIAGVLCNINRVDEAINIAEELVESSTKNRAYTKITHHIINEGNVDSFKSCIKQTLTVPFAFKGDVYYRVVASKNINEIYNSRGDFENEIDLGFILSDLLMEVREPEWFDSFTDRLDVIRAGYDSRSKEKFFNDLKKVLLFINVDTSTIFTVSAYLRICQVIADVDNLLEHKLYYNRTINYLSDTIDVCSDNLDLLGLCIDLYVLSKNYPDLYDVRKIVDKMDVLLDRLNNEDKDEAFLKLTKMFFRCGEIEQLFSVLTKISKATLRRESYAHIGALVVDHRTLKGLSNFMEDRWALNSMLLAHTDNHRRLSVGTFNLNSYLHDYSSFREGLTNVLFYQAKMACFFEEVRNEEKLDMLGEVLDIEDWRRVSASFRNN